MSKVQIVPNKKTGKLYQPTTNGKFFRVQVAANGTVERDGFFFRQNQIGFAYYQNEDDCKALIELAKGNGMQIPGKIVYLDQLVPITEEATEYGKQYPYMFRHNGNELTLEQRLQIQAACVTADMPLMQSGKAIYRKKIYTTDLSRASVILSPDNLDDVNKFIGTILGTSNGSTVTNAAAIREQRLAALKAIPKAKRTAEEKAELAELIED